MNSFNLFYMLKLAAKYWIALALTAVICAVATFGYYTYMVPPKFKATGSVMVTNGTILAESEQYDNEAYSKLQGSDISTSLSFASTVVDILKTSGIYKQHAEEISTPDKQYNFNQLKGATTIEKREGGSLYIDITYISGDPEENLDTVNKFLDLIPDYIETKVKNTSVAIEYADSSSPVYSNKFSIMLMVAFGGAVAVYLVLFLINSMNTVIKDEEDFCDHLNVTVIGVVPDFSASNKKYQKYYYHGYGGNKYAK